MESRGPDRLAPETARALTDRIRIGLGVTWQWVIEAYTGRAWEALGYDSWDDYCASEFAGSRLALPRGERAEVAMSMRDAGMSFRAIGSALGVSDYTARGDVSTARNLAVDNGENIIDAELVEDDEGAVGADLDDSDVARVARVFDRIVRRVTGVDGRERPSGRATTREHWERQVKASELAAQGTRQVDIAKQLGVAQSTVSEDLASMNQLLEAHGVDPAAVLSSDGLDARALADQLQVPTRPKTALASTAKAAVRDLQETLAVLMNSVILADGWIEDEERAAAIQEMVPKLVDVLLMLARAVHEVEMRLPEGLIPEEDHLRWSRTIAQARQELDAA
ncbi:hypothetical protein SAMN06309944_0693 [Micrococcales bacterium KH10]|nr:hypothetical protein SAMN06309944_0693 [Micrococcales bacterium KH10]